MSTLLLDSVPSYRRMTAGDVLACFVDDHRHQCQFDDMADPNARLTFDTTVACWREACDLLPWRPLGRAENGRFGTSFTDHEWRRVLEPAEERTLHDVCKLIGSQALAPIVDPLRTMGRECRPAAMFLAIRGILQRSGADVSELRPSSGLSHHLRRYVWPLLDFCSKVAPGRLPAVRIAKPAYDACIWTFFLSLIAMKVINLISEDIGACVNLLLAPAAALAYAGAWIAAKRPPDRVEFADLRTFRDLSYTLCGEESDWRPSSTRRETFGGGSRKRGP